MTKVSYPQKKYSKCVHTIRQNTYFLDSNTLCFPMDCTCFLTIGIVNVSTKTSGSDWFP